MFRLSKLFLGSTLIAAAALAVAIPASAQSDTGSSDVNVIPAPSSAAPGALYDRTMMTGFLEQQNLTLSSPLRLDISAPGSYTAFASGTGSPIPAGSVVSSFFPTGSWVFARDIGPFSLTVAQPILGLIVSNTGLDMTDSLLDALGTTYSTGSQERSFESDGDTLALSTDRHTL